MQFEVAPCGRYRFVGRAVYIGNKGPNRRLFDLSDFLWKQSDWIFEELDGLKEFASDQPHNAALTTWEKYDDKNALYGYYIGRFMQADAPVPEGMDYFDIDEAHVAKAWMRGKRGDRFGDMLIYGEQAVKDEIERTGLYRETGWVWMAEIYPKPDETGESFVGVYIPCEKAPSPTPE